MFMAMRAVKARSDNSPVCEPVSGSAESRTILASIQGTSR